MQHVISVTVENKPGVLARIASMFARRGFNIHSLAVGPTEDPTRSRITMVVDFENPEQFTEIEASVGSSATSQPSRQAQQPTQDPFNQTISR